MVTLQEALEEVEVAQEPLALLELQALEYPEEMVVLVSQTLFLALRSSTLVEAEVALNLLALIVLAVTVAAEVAVAQAIQRVPLALQTQAEVVVARLVAVMLAVLVGLGL